MKTNIGVIDVETGGLDPKQHPITQIAIDIITPIDFVSIYSYDAFVKPYNNLQITPKALESSRVAMKDINAGIDTITLIRELIRIFKLANKSGKGQTKLILVGHNTGFDMGFLEYFFQYMNKNLYDYVSRSFLDTMLLAKLMEAGNLKSTENQKYNLTALSERFGIKLHNAHGAPADVQVTKQVLIKILNNLRNGNNSNSSTNNNSSKSDTRKRAREGFFFEM
jgi:DNA polymerase III alpha subunit (gram-positive type)